MRVVLAAPADEAPTVVFFVTIVLLAASSSMKSKVVAGTPGVPFAMTRVTGVELTTRLFCTTDTVHEPVAAGKMIVTTWLPSPEDVLAMSLAGTFAKPSRAPSMAAPPLPLASVAM